MLLKCSDRSCFPRARFPYGVSVCSLDFSVTDPPPAMDFDSALGFPGEGPAADLVCLNKSISVVRLVFAMFLCCAQGVLIPRIAGDLQRQTLRNARPPLQEGRPVLSVTTQLRSSFLQQFDWLRARGRNLEMILDNPIGRVDEINRFFGWLWQMSLLCWSSVGEFLGATRKDLLLPTFYKFLCFVGAERTKNSIYSCSTSMCQIRCAGLVVSSIYPLQRLWPRSGQTLRHKGPHSTLKYPFAWFPL